MSENGKLSPVEIRILVLLTDRASTVETSAEIAQKIHASKGGVDHMMCRIYAYFGVRSQRGLMRRYQDVLNAIAENNSEY